MLYQANTEKYQIWQGYCSQQTNVCLLSYVLCSNTASLHTRTSKYINNMSDTVVIITKVLRKYYISLIGRFCVLSTQTHIYLFVLSIALPIDPLPEMLTRRSKQFSHFDFEYPVYSSFEASVEVLKGEEEGKSPTITIILCFMGFTNPLPQIVTSMLKLDVPKAFVAWQAYRPASSASASFILNLDVTRSNSRISVVLDLPGNVRYSWLFLDHLILEKRFMLSFLTITTKNLLHSFFFHSESLKKRLEMTHHI